MKAMSYFCFAFKQPRHQSLLGISVRLNSCIDRSMSNFTTNTQLRENNSTGASKERVIREKYQCCTSTTRYECDFTWTIQHFKSFLLGEGGKIIRSPTFSAAKDTCKWFLELRTPGSDDYTLLNLKTYDSKADFDNFGPISGEFTGSIMNSDGSKKNTRKKNIEFHSSSSNCGIYFMNDKSVLTDEDFIPQGGLIIHCALSYIRGNDLVHVFDQRNTSEPNTCLPYAMGDFEKILNNEELSDVTIYVGNAKYPAHKVILAAKSSLFQSMFTGRHKYPTYSESICVDDIDKKVFLEMLRYIYTGKVENIESMAFDLFIAAYRYEVAGLKMMCENELCRMLAVDTAVKILSFSNTYNLEKLKNRAIEYVKINLAEISDSKDWNDLISQPDLLKAVLKA